MSSRAFHSKSRHGCLTCKQRRKKCDMQRPICGICRRLCLKCAYQDVLYPGSQRRNNAVEPAPTIPQYPHPLYQALANRFRSAEIMDFELASHYLKMDNDSFATIPGLTALRRLDFATITLQYPYLLHGVLSASALYLASTQTDIGAATLGQYRQRAIYHQQFALSSYIKSLSTINAQSCQFIFGFSIILAGLHLAFCSSSSLGESDTLQTDSLIDNIAGVFHLMLGAVTVADEASKWIPACRAEPILLPIRTLLQCNLVELDGELEAAFTALVTKIRLAQSHSGQSCSRLSAKAAVCLSAVMKLRNVFGHLKREESINYKAVIGWLAFVDRSYVDLVRARQPIALIVLSYFGVALHEIRSVWWLHSIGADLVLAVDRTLRVAGAQEWYALSGWAASKVLHTIESQITTSWSTESLSVDGSLDLEAYKSFEIAYEYICLAGFNKDNDSNSATRAFNVIPQDQRTK